MAHCPASAGAAAAAATFDAQQPADDFEDFEDEDIDEEFAPTDEEVQRALQGMHALLDEADRQLTQRRLEMQAEESGAYYQFFDAGSSELPAAPSLLGGDRIQQPRIGRRVHRVGSFSEAR